MIITDQVRTGKLIKLFRTKLGLTQKELAERICVSDKSVSKWECGNGCPDVSLLSALAEVFGIDVRVLLAGEIDKNEKEKGDMKKMKFYVCSECGNIITAAADAAVTCCGNKLAALELRRAEKIEQLRLEDIGGEWFISSDHPMTKEHYISFTAYQGDNSIMIFRQYPEWACQMNIPMYRSGRIIWYCDKCGLLYLDIERKER